MIRLAFSDPKYGEQVRTNPKELAGVEVVYRGGSLADLESRAATLAPSVVVVHLEELGDAPLARLDQVLERTGARLAVCVYAWARREVVLALAAHPRARPVQGPLSLANLRCQMLHLIVSDLFADAPAAGGKAACPRCGGPQRELARGAS